MHQFLRTRTTEVNKSLKTDANKKKYENILKVFLKEFWNIFWKKNNTWNISDTWMKSCLSHRPRQPGYYIVDWQICRRKSHQLKRYNKWIEMLTLETTDFCLKMVLKSDLKSSILKFYVPSKKYLLKCCSGQIFLHWSAATSIQILF